MAKRSSYKPPDSLDDDGDDLGDEPIGTATGVSDPMATDPQVKDQRETPEIPAPRRAGVAKPGSKLRAIKVPWKREMAPPPVERVEMWLGVTDESPLQNIVLGGLLFPRYSREIPLDKNGDVVKGKETRGIRVRITKESAKAIEEDCVRHVVRRVGVNAVTLDTKDHRYERQANDLPIGCFLYAVEIHQRMPVDWHVTTPAPIIEIDTEA